MTEQPSPTSWSLQSVPPSPYFDPAVAANAVQEFGADGAWLLMSIVRYGWRAYFDVGLAVASAGRPLPSEPAIAGSIDAEFDAARMLQVQGLAYAVAEQLATLIYAAQKHESGTDSFFRAYTGKVNLVGAVKELVLLDKSKLAELLGVDRLDDYIASIVPADNRDDSEIVQIGPWPLERSAVSVDLIEELRLRTDALLDTFVTNFEQMQALVVPPQDDDPSVPAAQSLRHIDNSFRHGLRVLFHSASPVPRQFQVVGNDAGEAVASIYMPSSDGEINYGGIDTSQDATMHMLDVLRWLSVRVGQFAYAFLGFRATGSCGPVVDATFLHLGGPPVDAPPPARS